MPITTLRHDLIENLQENCNKNLKEANKLVESCKQ
jgi:hypothetical protein